MRKTAIEFDLIWTCMFGFSERSKRLPRSLSCPFSGAREKQRELGKEKRRMACTDTAKDVNNALHQCGDAAAKIITLQYAAYMN
jgi:hypothetical protein